MDKITHAYVKFAIGAEKITTTENIENHQSKNKNDFIQNQKYKVWQNGSRDNNDLLINSFIILLGGKFKS